VVKIVVVTWKDIIQHADWTPVEEVACPTFQSIGWLAEESEEEIKIGSTLDDKDAPFGITAFPKGCVLEVKELHL
jgi:hypothetical protein|tara:strand:+ start:1504 stop:1728 length:225 start_codon:yes stop_codon:yes gene_type:complete